MQTMGRTALVALARLTSQDLAQLLAASGKDGRPDLKLPQYNGNPLEWHVKPSQNKSVVDSATLSDNVKLTDLKTPITGKAKATITVFAYCGSMYWDVLRMPERKFGQPYAIVSAHIIDKSSLFRALKMHTSENIITYFASISAVFVVFRSLRYVQNLTRAILLGHAVQKLPPNLREAWAMYTVENKWSRLTLLEFNDWLEDKAEAYERIKIIWAKLKSD